MKINKNIVKQFIKGIFVFVLFYFSSYLQLLPIWIFKIKNVTGYLEVLLSSFSNIILLGVLFFLYRKELKREFIVFKQNLANHLDIGFKGWLIGLFGMMVFNFILTFLLKAGQANNEQAVQTMIKSLPWLMLINAGIIAPFIEEIVFRKCFKNIFESKYLFILTSGIFFGLMHVITNSQSLLDFLFFIPYSSLGIAFAYIYYKTDTIFTSVVMHMIHNTLLILLSIL